ncbi:MAG: SDR family oxidoreductase [Acidimicrobiales bacterium]
MQFQDKIGVVVGATQGLGAATARLLDERGISGLVLVGRDAERGNAVAESLSCQTKFLSADLAEPDVAAQIIATADRTFGRVDHLINCAALTVRGSVWDSTAEMWDDMLKVNTVAPALLITEAAKLMKRDGIEGTIVNIGSVASYGGQDFLYPYSASKAALQAITRNASYSLMRHRIRVNLLQPGWMKTEGEDAIQRRFHGAEDGWLESAEAEQPFGRLIDPNEVARTICFLSSEESGMMTGAVIDFDQTVQGAGDAPKPNLDPVWGEETTTS